MDVKLGHLWPDPAHRPKVITTLRPQIRERYDGNGYILNFKINPQKTLRFSFSDLPLFLSLIIFLFSNSSIFCFLNLNSPPFLSSEFKFHL